MPVVFTVLLQAHQPNGILVLQVILFFFIVLEFSALGNLSLSFAQPTKVHTADTCMPAFSFAGYRTPLHRSDLIYKLSSNGRKFYKALSVLHSHSEEVIRARRQSLESVSHLLFTQWICH